MKKTTLLLVLFLSTFIFAQEKTGLKGRIIDETQQPLPGATIYISDIKSTTSSDFNGYFELLNLPSGEYKISVTFIGYQTLEKKISIKSGIQNLNFTMTPTNNKLDEVIIKGSISRGQAKALNLQKSKNNITNIISADQVGKFPDANIGDALKRVPGITMQNDQGEARDIIIRGLAPQLNSVTINGDRLPSAEAENRRVQMDLIPSDMIQTVEVNKAVTPDMEGDAIGGSVNLITRSAPNDFRASLAGSFGIAPVREKRNYSVSGVVADRLGKNNKLGYVVSTSFNSNDYGSDNVEFEWADLDNGAAIAEQDIRRYDVRRDRLSASLNLDYIIDNNNTLFFKTMFNQRKDWENRFRLRLKDLIDEDEDDLDGDGDVEEDIVLGTAVAERETKGGINDNKNRRLENQDVFKASFGGEHIIFGNIKLDWKTGFAQARERRPNERYITFAAEDFNVTQDFSRNRFPRVVPTTNDFNTPSSLELDEVLEEEQYTRERKFNSKLNVLIPINTTGDYQNSVKFGYAFENKEKLRDNRVYEYTDYVADDLGIETMDQVPFADYTVDGYLAGEEYQSGNFATEEYLGGLDLQNGKTLFEDYIPGNYEATEDIYAGYAMLNQNIGDKFYVLAGARLEKTSVKYTGYSYNVDEENFEATEGNKDFTNFMPNLQLKYNFTNNTIVRAAWTNTIARPNYFDLVPYEILEDEDIEKGNPDLDPTTSMNFDLMGEHYFSNVGILSAGAFHKNIEDFIYSGVIENTLGGDTVQPFNGGTASVFGFEVGVQRKLNFLPSFLKNLTIYANYTFTDSETDGITGREDGLALAGAVKNMFNASLAYESNKLSARVSLNYADDYIDEYGDEAFEDRYYDEQLFLDVNASYKITEKLRVFGEAKNLTNQELRFYQGTKNQTMQAEFYDFNWNLGLKYNF